LFLSDWLAMRDDKAKWQEKRKLNELKVDPTSSLEQLMERI